MSAPDHSTFQPPATWKIMLAFAIIYCSWGTTYIATSIAMKKEHLPPALFGGVRLCVAGVLLLVWQWGRGQSLQLSWGQFLRLLVISWFLFLASNLLVTIGQKKVESGVAAILIATIPLWMALLAMFWPGGEYLSWRGWLGLVIGLGGIGLTMAPNLADGISLTDDIHQLCILGSALAWAAGSLVSRHMSLTMPHLTSAGYQMLFGGISQVSLGSAIGEWEQLPAITGVIVATFLYLLIVGSLSGFVAFNWLLGHVHVAKVGTYAYVNPIIAVLVGWSFGETKVHDSLVAGVAVTLFGVYLVRGDHRPSKELELEPD